jgi:SAM-dependent methyltransferase
MANASWDTHYTNEKADLLYPDENLVRLMKKNLPRPEELPLVTAIDLGCGSGRHLKLMSDLRIGRIIGLDPSYYALLLSQKHFNGLLLLGENKHIPVKNGSVEYAVAWGSLHYGGKGELRLMLDEISRILTAGGHLFATLRSSRDTYLKKGKHLGDDTWLTDLADINGTVVSFYGEEELTRAFSLYRKFRYGLIERTLLGDTKTRISHWVAHAIK